MKRERQELKVDKEDKKVDIQIESKEKEHLPSGPSEYISNTIDFTNSSMFTLYLHDISKHFIL